MSARSSELRVPCTCGAWIAVDCGAPVSDAACPACGVEQALAPGGRDRETGGLRACLACGHPELYSKKAFPRALGIAVVVVAAVLAPFTHYVSLAVAAILDLGLFRALPDVLACYVCRAEHRRFPARPRHPRFDREIEERLRYGAKAVMGKPMRAGGTADAAEPEH